MRKFAIAAIFAAALCFGGAHADDTIIGGGVSGMFKPGGGGVTGWCSLIPQSGLTNCWPMDSTYTTTSTATDPIGSKNATLTSATLNGSGPSTNLNNGLVCNGSSTHGDTSGTTTLLSGSTWSLVMWLNTAGVSGNRVMANDHTDSDNKGLQVHVFGTGVGVNLEVGNGTTFASAAAPNITASAWGMLTWTFSGTTITPYANTTAGTPTSFTGPVVAGTNNMSFCYNPAYSGDFYNGKLAGVAIYNVALTSGNVSSINALTLNYMAILKWIGPYQWGFWGKQNQLETINGL